MFFCQAGEWAWAVDAESAELRALAGARLPAADAEWEWVVEPDQAAAGISNPLNQHLTFLPSPWSLSGVEGVEGEGW